MFPSISRFPSLRTFWWLLDLVVQLLLLCVVCHFSLLAWRMPNFIPISWQYILTICIRFSNSFSFLSKRLMISMYIKWFMLSCDLLSLYPAVHFLKMWLSGTMAITKSNGDSASHWNMLLWTFTSAKLCLLVVNSSLQVCMVISTNSMI